MPLAARTAMADASPCTNKWASVATAYSTRNSSVNRRSPNCWRNFTSNRFIDTLAIT